MKDHPYLSLILPCFNEAQHLTKSIDTIIDVLKTLPYKFEIIFIDDKSQDQTPLYLKEIKEKYQNLPIRIYFHSKNKGRGKTVSEGILAAKGKVVGYMDIDCEVSPKYINKFVGAVNQECDVVVAQRNYEFKLASIHRHLASLIYSRLTKTLLKLPVSDTEAGFKFFNTHKIKKIISMVEDNYWFWDTEVIVVASQNNLKIKGIPVIFKRRLDKTSTVNLLRDSIKYLESLIKLTLKLKSYESHK